MILFGKFENEGQAAAKPCSAQADPTSVIAAAASIMAAMRCRYTAASRRAKEQERSTERAQQRNAKHDERRAHGRWLLRLLTCQAFVIIFLRKLDHGCEGGVVRLDAACEPCALDAL